MPNGRKHYDITALAYAKGGRLLAVGKNSYTKTHPLQAKIAAKVGKHDAIYLHAEMAALVKAREPVHRLVVLHYDGQGKPKNSAPCAVCREAIRQFGVKHVEHT